MHAHWMVSLGIALALLTPTAADEIQTSYSLKELRVIARSAQATIESADAAMEAAAGALQQAGAYPNPEVTIGVGRGRPRDGGDSRSESAIELVQPIELSGIRHWRKQSAELRARAVELDRGLAERFVDSTVSRLVYSVLLEQRRADIAEESVEVAFRLHELLQRRVELGESSPLEAVKARSEWFARRKDLVGSKSALSAARFALDLFCGDRLPESYAIVETLEGPGAVALPVDLVERLRTSSPALLRAGIAAEEAQARTEVARKAVFPRFDLFASYDSELDRTATSVGVGMTIPLWNRNRGEMAAASAEQARAAANTRVLVQELERSLVRASTSYDGALAVVRLHEEGWTATARQALEISTFSFENGEASLLDVLDAQRSYLEVRSAEAESWAALALARADIELLLARPLNPENTDEAQ